MAEYSFDIVCKPDMQELNNAIHITEKELSNRFDFKGAIASIKLEKEAMQLEASDEMKMKQMIDALEDKLVKRGINLKAFQYGPMESNVSGLIKCKVNIQQGLSQEQAKKVTKLVKEANPKVQTRIQGDAVRVTGKSKDHLQEIMATLKSSNLDFAVNFENYR